MSEEESAQQKASEEQQKAVEEQQKKADAHEAGKTVVKDGAKIAGEYFAPGLGGMAVEKIASTKAGEMILDKGSEALNKIPGVSDKLAESKPMIDEADKAMSKMGGIAGAGAAGGASAGAGGASAGASGASAGASNASAAASSTPSNAEAARFSQPQISNRQRSDSSQVEIKSDKPIHGENLRKKGDTLQEKDEDSSEEQSKEEESSTQEEQEPEEHEYQEEEAPDPEKKPKEKEKKKNSFFKITLKIAFAPLLIVLGVPLALLFLIILYLYSDADASNSSGAGGLTQYETACNQVTVVDAEHEGENGFSVNGTYDLDTYIAGVVVSEVGSFHNEEIFKAFAVAARTYALRHFESSGTCSIAGNTTKQSFMSVQLAESKGHNMDVVMDAVKATMGMVLTDQNGNLISTEYDAFCMDHKDENYYYLRQQNQALDRAWVESTVPSSYRSGVCAGGHGRGMSQYGALYLAMQQGKNYQEILEYYYEDIELQTILNSSASSNYTIATSTGAQDQLRVPLREFLQSKGTNIASFNTQIMEAVKKAGPGTRDGVVAAATSLIGTLYEQYQGRIPYTLSGGHGGNIYNTSRQYIDSVYANLFGVNPEWGSPIRSASGGTFYYNYYGDILSYTHYGPDCSGFVAWALNNGGFYSQQAGAREQGNYGPKHIVGGSYIGQPGDLVWHEGHIMLLVGVDEANEIYYIAESAGGSDGTRIKALPFHKKGGKQNYIVDMTQWYASHVKTNDPAEYEQLFRAGMRS